MIFQRRVKILSLTRGTDWEKDGEDAITKTSMLLEDQATRYRYEINDLDVPLDDNGYLKLKKAYSAHATLIMLIDVVDDEEGKSE